MTVLAATAFVRRQGTVPTRLAPFHALRLPHTVPPWLGVLHALFLPGTVPHWLAVPHALPLPRTVPHWLASLPEADPHDRLRVGPELEGLAFLHAVLTQEILRQKRVQRRDRRQYASLPARLPPLPLTCELISRIMMRT